MKTLICILIGFPVYFMVPQQNIDGIASGNEVIISNPNDCPTISDVDFAKLLVTIKESSTEEEKFKQTKLIMRYYCVYTNQLLQVMQNIKSEAIKLDLAKFAYEKILDKDNFNTIHSEFNSTSIVKELTEYIRMRY